MSVRAPGAMESGPGSPRRPPIRETKPFFGWTDSTLITLLVFCAALPYLNTLLNSFVYDDNTQVLNNPYILSFRNLGKIFSTTVWSFSGAPGGPNYYRPLMTTGYLLCFKMFGPSAAGFHLANIILHCSAVFALFAVAKKMFQERDFAIVAAGAFALHPIHVESVAWIAAVTDLELTFFFLLAFWFFLRASAPGRGGSWRVQCGLAASFVLALLAKEQAALLPALATAYEHLYREDRGSTTRARKASRYASLWVLSAAYFLFRTRHLGFAIASENAQLSLSEVFFSALALLGQYLWKLLWPVHLCAYYVFRKSASALEPGVLAGAAGLIVCGAVYVCLWRGAPRVRRPTDYFQIDDRRPAEIASRSGRIASFGILWLLATLAPVLNGRAMVGNVFAERYLYLPSVGFCWLLAFAWVELWRSNRNALARAAFASALLGVAGFSVWRIVSRNRDWRDDLSLYSKTLAASPDAFPIRVNLGAVYWGQGNAARAEREWREALQLAPHSPVILNDLGLVYARQKRYDQAVEYYRQALDANPNYTDAHVNLGVAFRGLAEREPAERQYRIAVALSPLNFQARNRLGELYLDEGRLREAEEQFRLSAESAPNVIALDALGAIFLGRGDSAKSERAFLRALSLNPADALAHFKLGAIYAARGSVAAAIEEYEAGLRADPTNAQALAVLRKLRSHEPGSNLRNP